MLIGHPTLTDSTPSPSCLSKHQLQMLNERECRSQQSHNDWCREILRSNGGCSDQWKSEHSSLISAHISYQVQSWSFTNSKPGFGCINATSIAANSTESASLDFHDRKIRNWDSWHRRQFGCGQQKETTEAAVSPATDRRWNTHKCLQPSTSTSQPSKLFTFST